MKNLLFVLTLIIGLSSCSNSSSSNSNSNSNQIANNKTSTPIVQKEYIEVLYFHGKKRCATCNTIETRTKELLENNYAEDLRNGKIIFRIIDISTEEGEKIANKYEVAWSSLYINKWKNGKEDRNNLTDFAFSAAKKSPDLFTDVLKKDIEELRNQ